MGRGLDLFREGDSPIYTLTFVRDLTPAELLTRMAVDPETLALRDGRGAPLQREADALVESAFDIRLRQPGDVDDERWSGRLLLLPG